MAALALATCGSEPQHLGMGGAAARGLDPGSTGSVAAMFVLLPDISIMRKARLNTSSLLWCHANALNEMLAGFVIYVEISK